jgi:acetyl esterase
VSVAESDVEYQPGFLARIYQPEGDGPFPTILEVHGGAWHIGDRLNNADIDRGLAERGVLVAAVDFRQSQDAPFPASLYDVSAGARWLKAHARDYNGVPEIGGLGSSSGGHQILLTAVRPHDFGADATLAYVVGCWPVANPLERYRNGKREGKDVQAYEAYWPSEADMEQNSPELIVQRGEAESLPPLFIVQGTADELVTPAMQAHFVQTYRNAGGDVEMITCEGMPHTFIIRQPTHPESLRSLDAMAAFIQARHRQ